MAAVWSWPLFAILQGVRKNSFHKIGYATFLLTSSGEYNYLVSSLRAVKPAASLSWADKRMVSGLSIANTMVFDAYEQ
jgi:hypothetical protein